MLSKGERLGRDEFSRFFTSGTRRHTPLATIIYTPSSTLRAAVVVSKKVSKKAVDRNTLRRRLYAALFKEKMRGTTGVFIVVAKAALATLPRKRQQEEIASLFGTYRKER